MPDEAVLSFLHWKKKTGRLNEHELLLLLPFLALRRYICLDCFFFLYLFFGKPPTSSYGGRARCCHSWKVLRYFYKLIKMHAAADPLNVDRAVLKLQQLCVVNVLIDRQCSSQRKLCSVDVFKQLRHWTRQMKKYLLFCVRHFPEVLCDATKGTAVFQVGDYTPPTDNQKLKFWQSITFCDNFFTFLL